MKRKFILLILSVLFIPQLQAQEKEEKLGFEFDFWLQSALTFGDPSVGQSTDLKIGYQNIIYSIGTSKRSSTSSWWPNSSDTSYSYSEENPNAEQSDEIKAFKTNHVTVGKFLTEKNFLAEIGLGRLKVSKGNAYSYGDSQIVFPLRLTAFTEGRYYSFSVSLEAFVSESHSFIGIGVGGRLGVF